MLESYSEVFIVLRDLPEALDNVRKQLTAASSQLSQQIQVQCSSVNQTQNVSAIFGFFCVRSHRSKLNS